MKSRILAAVAACAVVHAAPAFAGPLNPPPGPIASTPRIEARTPITATTTPGDALSVFRIAQPGSYYLTGNVDGVSGRSGIIVATPGPVTIDLNGFALVGVAGAAQGIGVSGNVDVTVMNGTVSSWPGNGVTATKIDGVTARLNGGAGIACGESGSITRCTATNNGGITAGYGILTGSNCVVADCIANFNGGTSGGGGIAVGGGSQVLRCTVVGNAVSASSGTGFGVAAGLDGIIADCRVNGNGTATNVNTGGILSSAGTNITGCALYNNRNFGISAAAQARVVDNSIGGIGSGSPAAAIIVGGSSRVEGNHVFSSNVGVRATGTGSVVVRNSVRGASPAYDIAGGNDVGPIGTAATSASPWANLQGP